MLQAVLEQTFLNTPTTKAGSDRRWACNDRGQREQGVIVVAQVMAMSGFQQVIGEPSSH